MVARILLTLLFLLTAKAIYNIATEWCDTHIGTPISVALKV